MAERTIQCYIQSIENTLLEVGGALNLEDWSGVCQLLEGIEEDLEAARLIAEGHEEAGQRKEGEGLDIELPLRDESSPGGAA